MKIHTFVKDVVKVKKWLLFTGFHNIKSRGPAAEISDRSFKTHKMQCFLQDVKLNRGTFTAKSVATKSLSEILEQLE